MATIETKYSIGDVVFIATTTIENKRHACPDCLGANEWRITSPAGGEYKIRCPRCSGYPGNRDLSLDYSVYVARVQRLTIGSVQFNSASGSCDSGVRYMCQETGIGSGSVYDEPRLFSTEEDASAAAELLAQEQNANTSWVVQKYSKSLDISEYQLDSAKIKLAKDAEIRASLMLWDLNSLFNDIEEAASKDAIVERVDEYKKWDWPHDQEKARAAIAASALSAPVEQVVA